jgi:threonyl-tRNA synthetase
MNDISVTLPDGNSRRVPAGTTPADIAAQISPGLARVALAAFVGDRMVDLSFPIEADAPVRIVTPTSPEALALPPECVRPGCPGAPVPHRFHRCCTSSQTA